MSDKTPAPGYYLTGGYWLIGYSEYRNFRPVSLTTSNGLAFSSILQPDDPHCSNTMHPNSDITVYQEITDKWFYHRPSKPENH